MGRPTITLAILAMLATSCGASNSTTPVSPSSTPPLNPSPSAFQWSVSGILKSSVTGQPVEGATVEIVGGPRFTSGPGGTFLIGTENATAAPVQVQVDAPGYVSRRTWIQGGTTRSGIEIDVIQNAAPFSLTMYKELIRGALDGSLRATRRWQQAPKFYVRTVDENDAPVPANLVDTAVAVIPNIVGDVTGGRFPVAGIEQGTASTVTPGTVVITFPAASFGAAGRASGIGVSPCTVQVWQGDVPSGVPWVIAHEIAHCLGLSHITVTGLPPSAEGLMGRNGPGRWNLPRLTDAEKVHASILYARPAGNLDPDTDPAGWLFSRTDGNSAPAGWIECPLVTWR